MGSSKSGKPPWLKAPLPSGGGYALLRRKLAETGIHTVCEEARCPNIGECWSAKTATIMILGGVCTRACRFCHVKTGNPKGRVDISEIDGASRMVGVMGLRYLVITSVDRDDLPDSGAGHFAAVVERIAKDHPETKVEVLVPDFDGVERDMRVLADSRPFVIAQNMETVRRLTRPVRDRRAGYDKTLDVLRFYAQAYPSIPVKSSLMVGLGETRSELLETFWDLAGAGVSVLTLGQYLRPSQRHLKVERYYHPDEFEDLRERALEAGLAFVAASPMTRSSYKAFEYMDFLESRREDRQGP